MDHGIHTRRVEYRAAELHDIKLLRTCAQIIHPAALTTLAPTRVVGEIRILAATIGRTCRSFQSRCRFINCDLSMLRHAPQPVAFATRHASLDRHATPFVVDTTENMAIAFGRLQRYR